MSKRKIKVSFIVEADSTEHLAKRLQVAFGDGVVISSLWLQEMSEIQSDLEIQQYDYRDYQVTIWQHAETVDTSNPTYFAKIKDSQKRQGKWIDDDPHDPPTLTSIETTKEVVKRWIDQRPIQVEIEKYVTAFSEFRLYQTLLKLSRRSVT